MKIEFKDQGAVSKLVITSTVFEFRRHNLVVDITLFMVQGLSSRRTGFFCMKTVISGPSNRMLRAYKIALQEISR
ncbi:hypothetical protein [Superficieibacter sp. HKU1]|jgi:hypothetical protein|uniref:hypothetical protein n=1 Tax=Superficieibacter sp. HKU1 TaxID=3031919 RepID=UPI0023E23549|nr:hypothetical protein [Superficieibacter sp. HKU1]WES69126.1 hypothetical protein P0H77_03695 [Superficieibacter sp. HKU1]